MRIPKRVYGIENEFGVIHEKIDGTWEESRSSLINQCYAGNARSVRCIVSPARIWHPNGSCSYVDTGEHPEHATAECRSIKDAVLYAKAGEILIASLFSRPLDDNSQLLLFKNNLGCDSEGYISGEYGCHENYLYYTLDIKDKSTIKRFIPFLITRQIMDGAGWWMRDGTFLFSQRSICIMTETGGTTTNNRPLITLRDTTHDTGPTGRLHLIFGDANILDVACFLKLGTTSLVLSLLESGYAPAITYRNSIDTLKEIARDPDVSTLQDMELNGTHLSAYDVQVIYCTAARSALREAEFDSPETEAEMWMVVDLWEKTLNALYSGDEKWMLGRLDYATKRFLAKREIMRKNITIPSEMQDLRKDIDIFYHNITNRDFQNRMNRQWHSRRLLDDRQIEKATLFPPQGTRAKLRGGFVASALNIENKANFSLDWTRCGDTSVIPRSGTFQMPDPFTHTSDEFNDFLLKFLNRPHKERNFFDVNRFEDT
ncbi:MAG: proteasome accessory factor PafA2 family protein [bacterium]|nr:proteasome accessory factor PafA2 family protein [bacterium]